MRIRASIPLDSGGRSRRFRPTGGIENQTGDDRPMVGIRDMQEFFEGVQTEMKKVTWPDRDQLRNATAVILVFVIILAIIIGLMDSVFSAVVRGIVGLLSG